MNECLSVITPSQFGEIFLLIFKLMFWVCITLVIAQVLINMFMSDKKDGSCQLIEARTKDILATLNANFPSSVDSEEGNSK